MKHQGFKGLSKEEYRKSLLENCSLTDGIQLAIANCTTNLLLGDIYLKKNEDELWIGYTINPLNSGQGYIYEAISSVITWAKINNLKCLKAGVLSENISSISLLEKLGFFYIETDINGEEVYLLNLK